MNLGDNLFVYDIQDHNDIRRKIAVMDKSVNGIRSKTFSSIGSHNLLIHFSTDHQSVHTGFSALIHHVPNNTTCSDFLGKTELMLTNAMDCTYWIITAPFVTSTIDITFQYFEVYYDLTS